MGCGASVTIAPTSGAKYQEKPEKNAEQSVVEWKILPSNVDARKKFEADGTLTKNADPEHLELRTMLDDPFSQNAIGTYAKLIKSTEVFMCWVDIQEFKSISKNTDDYRRSKALHIYHKYIKPQSVLEIGEIDQVERDKIKHDLDTSKDDPSSIHVGFYDKVQFKCFLTMYQSIYIPFKLTKEYTELTQQIKKRYNNVRMSDFEYFNKLGEGGFGFVVHCRKKSTGKHYAMKLQTKKGLLECFQDDPMRADFEKQAFASCQHPFIVNLDYAFQTDALAIMVLGLSTAGDLQKALNRSPEERLDEERVRFYVAEIVLALSYLHQLGLMYRDLKPNNVLLNEDGHIQLVDLGGVADEHGTTLGKKNEVHGLVPLFTQTFTSPSALSIPTTTDQVDAAEDANKRTQNKRKLSIMGTFGYMAPEMVIMLSQASYEKTGYSVAVDWWSLGVTMFKLLTGYRPFTDDNFTTFVDMATTMNGLLREHCDSPEYAILFQEIQFPPYMSKDARDLISKLLDVNDKTRLGSNGVQEIQAHTFFKGIDWSLLEQKHLEPPYKPPRPKLFDELEPYGDFETLMKDFNKSEWLNDIPTAENQKYFANWDFTSPHTIRVETGISHQMEQFDRNFKVRQIMGPDADKFASQKIMTSSPSRGSLKSSKVSVRTPKHSNN